MSGNLFTKIGLAVAVGALLAFLIFGYVREFVPTAHQPLLSGQIEGDSTDALVIMLEAQPGVQTANLRLVQVSEDAPQTLFGQVVYDGFTIWIAPDDAEDADPAVFTAAIYRRRLAGEPSATEIDAALADIQQVILSLDNGPVTITPPSTG